jgi:polysaccharide pyruvyl transferase WcaK-like protein
MKRENRRIALLDHVGGGNLGDDATQTAVIQNIRSRWPHAEIIGLSMNPADTQEKHAIPSYAIRRRIWVGSPIRGDVHLRAATSQPEAEALPPRARLRSALSKHRVLFRLLGLVNLIVFRAPKELFSEVSFLFRSCALIKACDLLIISGGGQLLDCWGGPWEFPYTIWKWILLAKMSNVKCVFLNVGAGPVDRPLSRFFLRQASRFADYVSFRDEQSQVLMRRIGFTGSSKVVADNVYGLEFPTRAVWGADNAGSSIVGLSPMAYCHPELYWKKDQRLYDSFIRKLAAFGSALIGSGHRIVLFTSDVRFDRQTIQDLKQAIESQIDVTRRSWITDEPVDTTENLLHKMSFMDYVVTCRFHGVVFAHLLNKPVIAISHHPKVSTLMGDIGLSEYCLGIDSFDADSVSNKFALLVKNVESVRTRMADSLVRYRSELANQFDGLFPQDLMVDVQRG